MIRVLVGGAGGTGGNNFIRSLKEEKEFYIIGMTSNKNHVFLSEADETYYMPLARGERYIDNLVFLIKKTKPDFIYACHDFEVEKLSENREILDNLDVKYFLPSKRVIRNLVNKYYTNKIWKDRGIFVYDTIILNTEDDLRKILKKYNKIWIRNVEGGGGNGSLPTDDYNFAKAWIDHFEGWGKFSATKCLSNKRVSFTSIWFNGELIIAQTREGLSWLLGEKTLSGVTGVTDKGITIDDEQINELSIKAIKSIDEKPNGIYTVDISYDYEGNPIPTEINPGRFFTPINFFTELGLNFPLIYTYLALDMKEKLKLPNKKINPLPNNLCWLRNVDTLPKIVPLEDIENLKYPIDK